jgi:hypothetical protein
MRVQLSQASVTLRNSQQSIRFQGDSSGTTDLKVHELPVITAASLKRFPKIQRPWLSLKRPTALLAMQLKQRHRRHANAKLQAEVPQLVDYMAFDRRSSGRGGEPTPVLNIDLPKLGLSGQIRLERTDYETKPKALHLDITDAKGRPSKIVIDLTCRDIQSIGNSTPIVIAEQSGPLFEGSSPQRLTRVLYDILHQTKDGLTPFKTPYIRPESRLAKVLRRVSRHLPF